MPNSNLFKCLVLCLTSVSFAQDPSPELLRVFLDCDRCDNTYIRQNLGHVEFVRDQGLGDVHLFFMIQRNGSGGRQYDIDFIGKNQFSDINYKLSFSTDTNMTSDDVRRRIMEYIKLGLVRFWIENKTIDMVTVEVPKPEINEDEKNTPEKDPWNYWVFNLGANGWFDGQETNNSSSLGFNISAKRVTDKNKFSFRLGFNENKSTFSYDGSDIVAINNSRYINISDVISINDHWSYGAFASLGTSTFSNYDSYWSLSPAIEYNLFKYEDSAKKQLILSYRIGLRYNDYIERSVYAKNHELLPEHRILLGGSFRQEWGNVNSEASFQQFLHDTKLNALGFYLGANIRIFRGFNFNVGGNYRITRNQINLAAGDVSLEELLLQQQQLESGYNYWVNLGFSYSFGSIYNTIVNPRFNF